MRMVIALPRKALHGCQNRRAPHALAACAEQVVDALAPICLAGHQVVITHGDGPQTGWLAMQSSATPDKPYSFESVDTENIGMVGHLIERDLANVLPAEMSFAALSAQIRIDRHDPSFSRPSVPVGPIYGESEARALGAERGWRVAPQVEGWRRVVASPTPREILEARMIKLLLERDVTVICALGGSVTVVELEDGTFAGVEAIVGNAAASALLALQIEADWLLLLTHSDAARKGWPEGACRSVERLTSSQLARRDYSHAGMRGRAEAACFFVSQTGRRAAIGRIDDAGAMLRCAAGLIVSADLHS